METRLMVACSLNGQEPTFSDCLHGPPASLAHPDCDALRAKTLLINFSICMPPTVTMQTTLRISFASTYWPT